MHFSHLHRPASPCFSVAFNTEVTPTATFEVGILSITFFCTHPNIFEWIGNV